MRKAAKKIARNVAAHERDPDGPTEISSQGLPGPASLLPFQRLQFSGLSILPTRFPTRPISLTLTGGKPCRLRRHHGQVWICR